MEPGGYEADNFGVRCTDCIGMCKRKQWKDCRCGEADAEAVHENEANDYANEKLLEVFEGLFGKSDCE